MRCLWFWGDFGQPVYWSSGLCSCVAGEFAWYVLLWNLLALGWSLVSVQVWRLLDELSSINVPLSQEFSGVPWCSQLLDLSLLPLAFSLTLTVASRLLYPYSTNDKTSRLMVKRFSTVRDSQRGSQSNMEKRRGRKEIEVTKRRRGGVKRRETDLAINQFPKCSPQPRTLKEIHRFGQRREVEGRRQR